MNLTPRQQLFADKFIECCNACQAAIEAGYSKNTASAIASRLLRNVNVSKYIDEKMAEISKPTIASADEVLQYLTRVMRGEEKDQFGLDASLADRTKCAESLGKRYALFTDKIKHDGVIPVVLKDDVRE